MSRRVLIAWEFGSGLGHLAAMYPVICALRERGREPLVAVPEPERAREILGADAPRMIRAVPLAPPRRRARPPESFSDLLLQRGFSSEMLLERAVREWHDIYQAERIESVLLDYAPVAQLAAWTMSIPMTAYGVSFANPPLPETTATMIYPVTLVLVRFAVAHDGESERTERSPTIRRKV